MLLVALDRANGVAQQGVEAGAGDVGRPGVDVVHEQVHLVGFKFEVTEKMRGNFQKGEGVEVAASGQCASLHAAAPRAVGRALCLVWRQQQGSGCFLANLAKLTVGQFKQRSQHVDAALERAGNRLFVLDLVVQNTPGVLDQRANLQFERKVGQQRLPSHVTGGGLAAQVHVQALVAKRRFRCLHRADLVGNVQYLEPGLRSLRQHRQLVFVKTDDAQPDQVGDVGAYLVGGATFFQRRPVFARELAHAFVGVLDAPLHLGNFQARQDCLQTVQLRQKRCQGLLHARQVLAIKGVKAGCFQIKIERSHGNPLSWPTAAPQARQWGSLL